VAATIASCKGWNDEDSCGEEEKFSVGDCISSDDLELSQERTRAVGATLKKICQLIGKV
jgi:hypothetical protein